MNTHQSWGRFPSVTTHAVHYAKWRQQPLPVTDKFVLPYGKGRSYGDSCLNENNILLDTRALNHLIHFDNKKGILTCESGVTLADIIQFALPRGWFLPVVPGTQFVSVGGAIANDIHGKNHHNMGTFGAHVLSFELLRSDGQRYFCSPVENPELFAATMGGLGLTGLIVTATIKLRKIKSSELIVETIKFNNLAEFFDISSDSNDKFEYTVAWLDCVNKHDELGRGVFMRANHSDNADQLTLTKKKKIAVPINFPNFALNPLTIKVFNQIYFAKQPQHEIKPVDYESYFFPLDSLLNWNRIYGKRGFLQYQFVLPEKNAQSVKEILEIIIAARAGSFLSVLKMFGDKHSPGMLSFPMPGVTLALDFPFQGEKTLDLLNELDKKVMLYGGKVYPAKDARMSPEAFKLYYPEWEKFSKFIDPKFSSNFWRRVSQN